MTSVGYAATVATGTSCAVSVVRTYNALIDPNENETLDNMPAYQTTMTVVDGISLLGVGASAAATVKVIGMMKRTGVTIKSAKNGIVSRQARSRLARENVLNSQPGISNGKLKKLIRSGEMPKRIQSGAISAGTVHALRDSIAAGLSFLASALDGNVRRMSIYIVRLEN